MEGQLQHRILLIDSDERAMSVIKNFLVNDGFNVTTTCGEGGFSALQSCEYDLVLVDSHFADLALSSFLKRLLRIPEKLPVIVMEDYTCRRGGSAPYNPQRASRVVNKCRPCEILEAVHEVKASQHSV
jgi:DNA-binding NarL/FixJ family response regulator